MLHFILLVKEPENDSSIFCPNCEGQIQKTYRSPLYYSPQAYYRSSIIYLKTLG